MNFVDTKSPIFLTKWTNIILWAIQTGNLINLESLKGAVEILLDDLGVPYEAWNEARSIQLGGSN